MRKKYVKTGDNISETGRLLFAQNFDFNIFDIANNLAP